MTLNYSGNYFLQLRLGAVEIPLSPQSIEQFTVIQSMNKFLPSLKVIMRDESEITTHIIPSDSRMNECYVVMAEGIDANTVNMFDFDIYRKFPDSRFAFDIEGLLHIEGLVNPTRARGFDGTIKAALTEIATRDLGIKEDDVDISPSLDYKPTDLKLVQPNWTNTQFLRYLRRNVIGKNGESCFYCFMKKVEGKTKFVFKSLKEFVVADPIHFFMVGDKIISDFYPIIEYKVYNNYRTVISYASKQQSYSYFDYENSKYVDESINLSDYPSLAEYHLIDQKDKEQNTKNYYEGRSNSLTSDFQGKVTGEYYKRITSLVMMEMVTVGRTDIDPGDIVLTLFPRFLQSSKPIIQQYSGFWMVQRVIHQFGKTYTTKLLLTRNGIDTSLDTNLVKALNRKVGASAKTTIKTKKRPLPEVKIIPITPMEYREDAELERV